MFFFSLNIYSCLYDIFICIILNIVKNFGNCIKNTLNKNCSIEPILKLLIQHRKSDTSELPLALDHF